VSSRGAITAAVGVFALGLGFVAGQVAMPNGSDRARAGFEQASGNLRAQVFQPPDASQIDGENEGFADRDPIARATALETLDDLLACETLADGTRLCDHGSEDPPPGVDPDRLPTVAQLKARGFDTNQHREHGSRTQQAGTAETDEAQVVTPEAVAGTAAVPCIGDGRSGPRVQAVYAHAADKPSRYTEVLPLIQQYAADVSDRLNYAAGRSGEGRVVRYVTSGAPCVLDVANVTLSPKGDDTFGNTIAEMRERGYNRADRKYLVWVDAAVGICGIANVFQDDRPTLDNANARGNMFARADAPCWGYAELHELLHTLGAVQNSAPNSTNAGHCYDETDAMCYEDTSGTAMKQACANEPAWNVDCRLDDYFNAAPPAGTYLAQRWNVARSPYLQTSEPPPPLPRVAITSVSRAFAGNAWTVTAEPELSGATTAASFKWTSSRTDCRFEKPGALKTRYWCPVTAATGGRVRAWLKNSAGAEATQSKGYVLAVPASPRRTLLSLTRSTAFVRAGQTALLRTRLTDPTNNNGVIGMPISLYRRVSGQTAWEKIATKSTAPTGRASFAVKPTRTTDYQVASGSTATWKNGNSTSVRITVRH
jgi:hypothetical protein